MEALGWLGAVWGSRYLEIYISIISMAVALWMGLYLLRRGAGTTVGLLSASTALLLALIYALETMLDAPGITARQYELLLRAQGLVVPLPFSIWVCLSYLIRNNRRVTLAVKRVSLIVGLIGASQVWLRAFTDWHYDYSRIYPSPFIWQDWWTPRGMLFPSFAILALAALLWSTYNIFRPFYDRSRNLRRLAEVEQFWPLFAGMCLFFLSFGYLVAAYALDIESPEVIGLSGVTLGVVAIGFGVFWHNTFVEEGRDITIDFLASLAVTGAFLALYAAVIYLVIGFEHLGVGPLVLLVAMVAMTHSSIQIPEGLLESILDRVGLQRWAARQRQEALLRVQGEKESREALVERLSVLLEDLCREVSSNRGYVALRDGEGFVVQSAHGVPSLALRLVYPELVTERIKELPYDLQTGELEGMGLVVPLKSRGRQAGVVLLGQKRYDYGETNRIIVHQEAMQRAIEAVEVAEEIAQLQRQLARVQRLQQPSNTGDDRNLLALCARSGLSFRNAGQVIVAATQMLKYYRDDPYALEKSPFLKCSRVQSRLARGQDQRDAVAFLEAEIARTIAYMKPTREQSPEWRRWCYLNLRYIDRYNENDHRYTMDGIAKFLGVSRKTLARGHERTVRDFVIAFLDPRRPASTR